MLAKSSPLLSLLSAVNQRAAIQNRHCHSIKVGSKASLSKVFTQADVEQFAKLSLDNNEIHLNADAARKAGFEKQIVHGILVNGLVSPRLIRMDRFNRLFYKIEILENSLNLVCFINFKRLKFSHFLCSKSGIGNSGHHSAGEGIDLCERID